jgi:hypothetical protein
LLLGEEAVGCGEFLGREGAMLLFSRLHGTQALFDTKRSLSSLI